MPPSAPPTARPLTAAEEKAQLQARYASENAQSNGGPPPPPFHDPPVSYSASNGQNGSAHPHPQPPGIDTDRIASLSGFRDPEISLGKQKAPPEPAPPPLPVKPPPDYYRPTEDSPSTPKRADELPRRNSSLELIDVRPFSPFSFDYEHGSLHVTPPPPPPLPPKPIM